MNRAPLFRKGHEFKNPNDDRQGYRITRDVFSLDPVKFDQFEQFWRRPKANGGSPHA